MGRPLRIEFSGAFYHVIAHAAGRQWIYKTPRHLAHFLAALKSTKNKFGFLYHAFVLMRNHYHILIETPLPNLSKGMSLLNGKFSRSINRDLGRRGPVFQRRYGALLVDTETYYKRLIHYIYRNPVKAGIVRRPEKYKGSSLPIALEDSKKSSDILEMRTLKFEYGPTVWRKILLESVNDPVADSYDFDDGYFIGDETWVDQMKNKVAGGKIDADITARGRLKNNRAHSAKIEQFIKSLPAGNQTQAGYYLMAKYSSLNHKDLAEKYGMPSAMAYAKRVSRFRKLLSLNDSLRRIMGKIESKLR